ncbi:hypothetical protein [Paraglaciecola sp. 20A4]|uniref:hypothetical protein n=1 Tax=Paraglaciecola sp. 20A4 TaxID=2687288 RepID=UPI001409CFCB|nr:hypothetical protein [Paraglaciecola sp. 20A4]
MSKNLNVALLVFLLTSCASNTNVLRDHITKLNQSERIIPHDFSKKYTDVIELGLDKSTDKKQSIETEVTYVAPQNIERISKQKEQSASKLLKYVDIEFLNESAEINDKNLSLSLISENIDTEYFLIIGHSHGVSSVGVETLSSKRARSLSVALIETGIPKDHIYFISAWSDGGMNYSISKGVRVVGLPAELSENAALITGITKVGL